jgi:hypothetical protein
MSLGHTKEDRIKTVYGGGGHVVILGAGASIAANKRNPLPNGKHLPSMDNFIEVVGLSDIVDGLPGNLKAKNFEELYSNLYSDDPASKEIKEIEKRVYAYFKDMRLPNEPTIYDYLILALRSRDVIATFNWDPFLYQAFSRNAHVGDRPYVCFLHGNVALGYNTADRRSGPAGMYSKATRNYYAPTKLLYPVTQKNYNNDEFIKTQWDMFDSFLSDKVVKRLTVFGYGAPKSDIEAIQLMNKAWGTGHERSDEQFEIIDIRPEKEVMASWDNFIYHGHTDYATDYFASSLAWNPRRTFESYHQHNFPMTIEEAFSESNSVPKDFKTLEELWDWHRPLIEAEEKYKKLQQK